MTIPAAPFAFQNRNMEVHDNTFHSNRYLHIFLEVASNYNAADIFVDATAAVSIASASITMSATESGYFPFLNAVLQYRPDNITINALVDFWIEVDIGAGFVQRSAKYPITVDLTHPTKRPFTMPFIPRNAADTAFWVTSRTNITFTVRIMAQRRVNADLNTLGVLISDRSHSFMKLSGDLP